MSSGVVDMSDIRTVPRPAQVHNSDHGNALAVLCVAVGTVLALPGALIGALFALLMWRATKPDIVTRWLLAALGAATAAALHTAVVIGWPWRALLGEWQASLGAGVSPEAVSHSIPVEILCGPAVLVLFQLGTTLWARTIHGQEWTRYRNMVSRKKALERGWPGPANAGAEPDGESTIPIGVEASSGQPFDLGPDELRQHIFIPGASGTGKTTTIVALAEGVLAQGHGAVFVDFKGSGLGAAAQDLAKRHGLPFTIVDPFDQRSVGYNPCSGEPAAVANKLIGAFNFSGEAEIYKQVAMEVVPIICRAVAAAKSPVSLDEVYEALHPGGLARLSRQLDNEHESLKVRLLGLDEARGVAASGMVGMQRRLGALMEGMFGEIFRRRPALDWGKVIRSPHVTYISLSAMAAGEDVELFGRVILQDLKQLCAERMRALNRGEEVIPALIVLDEFAALREATQVVDFLLQAREARIPVVAATQYVPQEPSIRSPLMSAGVLIVHRLEAEDADKIAAQFGTRTAPNLTAQVDYESGTSQKGSVRWVEEFNIHPNDLKELPIGSAAVYARLTRRRAVVRINRLN
jgi:hypothetical protein